MKGFFEDINLLGNKRSKPEGFIETDHTEENDYRNNELDYDILYFALAIIEKLLENTLPDI